MLLNSGKSINCCWGGSGKLVRLSRVGGGGGFMLIRWGRLEG
jgi:hypothetical protein